MARIRSIKPELWVSEDFRALNLVGRLAFLALISQADDYGRLRMSAKHLADVFVKGARTASVQQQLDLMESLSMVRQYAIADVKYIALCNWGSHQKVDHPKDSRIPEPPVSREPSRTLAKPLESERGGETTREPSISRARSGSDRSDQKERKEPPYPPTAQANGQAPPDGGDEEPAQSIWTAEELQQRTVEILAWWAALSGKDLRELSGQQARLTQQRAIAVARKSYEVADMCAVAEAWYGEQRDKPEQLYAPLLWPLFEQGGSAGIKKRKPHGLIRALVGSDPDEEPRTRPDTPRASRAREATRQPAAEAETHGGAPGS